MISVMSLKQRIKNIANEKNLDSQELMQIYMFERILERLSVSEYKGNFILKGGLLLSSMMGIDNRTTTDMDTAIIGLDVSKETIFNILNEILSIDLNDGVTFDIVKVSDIRKDDIYGGNCYQIKAYQENMKIDLSIDVSTGDVITSRELNYSYPLLLEDRDIQILSYNYETIIAEKLQTILSRGMKNSRMKDFYDLYFCITEAKDKLHKNDFTDAIINTFRNRNSLELLDNYKFILSEYIDYELFIDEWNRYKRNHSYVGDISFNETVEYIVGFMEELEFYVTN